MTHTHDLFKGFHHQNQRTIAWWHCLFHAPRDLMLHLTINSFQSISNSTQCPGSDLQNMGLLSQLFLAGTVLSLNSPLFGCAPA